MWAEGRDLYLPEAARFMRWPMEGNDWPKRNEALVDLYDRVNRKDRESPLAVNSGAFLRIAEDALDTDQEVTKRLGDRANWNYRHQKLRIAVDTLAAAAKAGTLPPLAGMSWTTRVGEDQVGELRRLLLIARNLLHVEADSR